MKILLPFQDPYNRPLTYPIISGGTEMFMKSIKENFDTVVYQFPYEQITWKKQSDKKEIAIPMPDKSGSAVIVKT